MSDQLVPQRPAPCTVVQHHSTFQQESHDVRQTAEDARAAYQCHLPLPSIWSEGEFERREWHALPSFSRWESKAWHGQSTGDNQIIKELPRLTLEVLCYLQVSVWLYDNLEFRIEGKIIVSFAYQSMQAMSSDSNMSMACKKLYRQCIAYLPILIYWASLQGFDEFMNVVMDEAEEVWVKQSRKPANDDSKDSNENGAQTSKTKRQFGDRRTLGESWMRHTLSPSRVYANSCSFLSPRLQVVFYSKARTCE